MNGELFPTAAPVKRYRTGMFDPPWWESGGGKITRGAQRHYPLMKTPAICSLPIEQLFEEDAHLYLWVTNNFLPDGLQVMKAWGFRYVTNIAWGKVSPLTPEDTEPRIQQGLGQYFRGAHELLLFGVRGQPPYRTTAEGKRAQHPSLVLAPRGRHSAKPPIFRVIAEKVSAGPYLEGFARDKAEGWDSWGNEVANDIEITAVTTDTQMK